MLFNVQLGVGACWAQGETAFGPLVGAGIRLFFDVGMQEFFLSVSYVHASDWGDDVLPFKDPSWVSVMLTWFWYAGE